MKVSANQLKTAYDAAIRSFNSGCSNVISPWYWWNRWAGPDASADVLVRFEQVVRQFLREWKACVDRCASPIVKCAEAIREATLAVQPSSVPVKIHDNAAPTYHEAALLWLRESVELYAVDGIITPPWLNECTHRIDPLREFGDAVGKPPKRWEAETDGRVYFPKMIEKLESTGLPAKPTAFLAHLDNEHHCTMNYLGLCGSPRPQTSHVHKATLAQAMIFENPEITPTELVEKLGVTRGMLYKTTGKWANVRRLLVARDGGGPNGFRTEDGFVDAYDE